MVGPGKKVKLTLTYPMATGQNFEAILRVIDSIQLTSKHEVATPVNWKTGEDVIVVTAAPDEDAKKTFGEFKEHKPYLRTTKRPR